MKVLPVLLMCGTAAFGPSARGSNALTQDTKHQQPVASSKPAPAEQTASTNPAEKIDPEKETAIRKMFEVMGTQKMMEQVVVGAIANIRPTLVTNLPPGEYREKLVDLFFQKFQAKFQVQYLMELSIPIYAKHFTKTEIDGLTAFYQTPLGQKALSVLPESLAEIQKVSGSFGEKLGRDCMIEVFDEHPELKKALEEASQAPKN
jgi:hypothetical protein